MKEEKIMVKLPIREELPGISIDSESAYFDFQNLEHLKNFVCQFNSVFQKELDGFPLRLCRESARLINIRPSGFPAADWTNQRESDRPADGRGKTEKQEGKNGFS